MCCCFFFFKQKTAYEMRISDWSSDVCSSDLQDDCAGQAVEPHRFRSVQDIVEGRMMENLARAHVLEFAGVLCKHLGRPRRQGRVDAYPRMRQTAGVDEHGHIEQHLLRPLKQIGSAAVREQV